MLDNNIVIQQEQQDIKPISYVKSCTECSMYYLPDGKPNVLGLLHRTIYWGHCNKCPVCLGMYETPATTADGKTIYWKGTDVALSEMDRIKLEADGGNFDLYCDMR